MENVNTLKPRRKLLKVILWTLFAIVIVGGAAFASWYFLINPATRAGSQQLQSFKVKVTEWHYWAQPELQPDAATQGVAYRTALNAWDDYEKLHRDGWEKVSLQSLIDAKRAQSVSEFYGEDPKNFYLVGKSMAKEYTKEIPKGNTWYYIGDLKGSWVLNADEGIANKQVPGHIGSNAQLTIGVTFYQLDVTQNNSQAEVKNVHAIQNGLDYRTNGTPVYYPIGKPAKDNYYSYGFATYAKYKGTGAYDTTANPKGTGAEITKAYRIVKAVADQTDSYDSYYSFSADASHYGLLKDDGDKMSQRANRSSIKNEKIEFSFKALDASSDTANGRGLYILGETPLSGGNFQIGADEYAWSYANTNTVKQHQNILHLSPDVLAQRNDTYLAGDPGWGTAPNYFETKLKYSDYDDLKTAYANGKFSGWKSAGDLNKGARVFNVGKQELSKQITFAGKTYTIYPVLVGAPGVAAPTSKTKAFDDVHVYWALKLNQNQTFDCEYTYNIDQNYRNWLATFLVNTDKGKEWVGEYRKNYKAKTGEDITVQEVIDKLKNNSSLLTNYRSLFSAYTVKDLSLKDSFFAANANSKVDVASAEVYSDPVSNFHSFPYFKKDGQYPEVKYPNQWKLDQEYVGAKAAIDDNSQVKLTWTYKNTFKPNSFRVYRSETQNFKPVGGNNGNQIATVESTQNQTTFAYTDTNPGLKDSNTKSQWYRVVAVYDSTGNISPWTKAFRAETEFSGGQTVLPTPTDVDAFGMDKAMEITWKAGSLSATQPVGGNQNQTSQAGSQGAGEQIRTFDVYRAEVDPGKSASQSASALINTAAAATSAAENPQWTKVVSQVSEKSGDKYIFVNHKLTNGKTYWYKIVEVSGTKKSADSAIDNDNPHVWADVNKDGKVDWQDVTRVLVYPLDYRNDATNRDITEDVNGDDVVDWYDIYGGEKEITTKKGTVLKVLQGILQYPGFPEVGESAASSSTK